MHENCDTCHQDYDFMANGRIHLYMSYLPASHLEAECPNGHTERIFITIDGLMQLLGSGKYEITFYKEPSNELRRAADETWSRARQTPEQVTNQATSVTYDLTVRLLALLKQFTTTLSACPDELLYDLIVMPQPTTLPEKWTNEQKGCR